MAPQEWLYRIHLYDLVPLLKSNPPHIYTDPRYPTYLPDLYWVGCCYSSNRVLFLPSVYRTTCHVANTRGNDMSCESKQQGFKDFSQVSLGFTSPIDTQRPDGPVLNRELVENYNIRKRCQYLEGVSHLFAVLYWGSQWRAKINTEQNMFICCRIKKTRDEGKKCHVNTIRWAEKPVIKPN